MPTAGPKRSWMTSNQPCRNLRGNKSAPRRQNFFSGDNLFRRTGEVELKFSRAAGDFNFDSVQAAGDHPEAELFVDFAESVLLEAIAHVGGSGRDDLIAMLIRVYLTSMRWLHWR